METIHFPVFVCRRETCYNAWRGLRMTPLFGCFCPGSDQKKCERIYSFIYNNTCVGECDGNKQKIDFSPHWGATTFIYSYLYCHGNYIRSPVVVVVVPFCRVPIRLSRRRLLFFFSFRHFRFISSSIAL